MKQAARAGLVIAQLLESLGLDERMQQYRSLIIWDKVVGPQIAARARPVRIRDGVLEVNVDQPTWMQQLQLMKPKILARLNAELGEETIREIFLKRGKVDARGGATPPAEASPTWRAVQLEESEIQQVAGLLTTIADPELRQEMERFLLKQTRLLKANAGN